MENKRSYSLSNKLLLYFFACILILIAGFRPLEYFNDTDNYLIMIHTYDSIWQSEPTFWIINKFNQLLLGGNDQIFFLLYAILGVSIKVYAINRISRFPLISLYLYVCLYFLLLEMTQIRIGVAAAIFLLAIPDITNKDFKNYLIKTIIAISFHYTAIIMLPLYFINTKKINKKIFFCIPLIGIIFALNPNITVSILNILASFFPTYIENKILISITLKEEQYINNDVPILSVTMINFMCFYYFFLFKLSKLNTKVNILLLKIFALQIFIYYAFLGLPIFANRLSEFYGVCLIILIPNLILLFNRELFPTLFIFIWGLMFFSFKSISLILF